MSDDFSDDEEDYQWSNNTSMTYKEEISIDIAIDICEDLKRYTENMGIPLLNSPYVASALYNFLIWKLG